MVDIMKIGKSDRISKKDKFLINSFSDTPSDLVFWSFRYFLGRMTIATCCFARDLANAWPHLDERVQELIKRELEREFERDDEARALRKAAKEEERYKIYTPLGHDCDREAWELVRKAYTNE
jgi:hypothetical protein